MKFHLRSIKRSDNKTKCGNRGILELEPNYLMYKLERDTTICKKCQFKLQLLLTYVKVISFSFKLFCFL